MSDIEHFVPVKVWLPASTFKVWHRRASAEHVEVSVLLTHHAMTAARRTTREKRRYTRFDEARLARARDCARDGWTQAQIAAEVGVSLGTLKNHWQEIIQGGTT